MLRSSSVYIEGSYSYSSGQTPVLHGPASVSHGTGPELELETLGISVFFVSFGGFGAIRENKLFVR